MKLIMYVAVALLLSAGIYFGLEHVYKAGEASGKTQAEGVYQKQVAEAQKAVKQATDTLAAQKAQADKEKQDEVKATAAKYDTLVSSLRNRATRAEASKAGSSPASGVVGSCTGAQLYRDDAEFLAGYAQQAEGVRIERDYYYGQYESARKLLSGQNSAGGLDGTVSDAKPVP